MGLLVGDVWQKKYEMSALLFRLLREGLWKVFGEADLKTLRKKISELRSAGMLKWLIEHEDCTQLV